ncbi:MAG: hypothetical protein WCO18_02370 [bacterium]
MTKKALWTLINSEIDLAIKGGASRSVACRMILDQHHIQGNERSQFFRSRKVRKRKHWSYLQASTMHVPRRSMVKAEGKK